MVVPDVLNDVFLPQETYPENFVLIAQSEVCQEGWVKKGGDLILERKFTRFDQNWLKMTKRAKLLI